MSYTIEGSNPKFSVWMHLWMAECHIPFSGHFDLVCRIIVSRTYLILLEMGITTLVCGRCDLDF